MLGKRVSAALAIGTASLASVGLARPAFAAAGGLDPTFGNGEKVLTPVGGIVDNAALQPNGDIVAIGFSEDNAMGAVSIALARYLG